ncbi:hypothetical protein GCM10027403_29840 [Arthrobacter tecti]
MAGAKFFKYHWNRLEKGSIVVVSLSKAANVRLMDSTNLNAYKNGRSHRYSGGLVTKTPFRIHIPRTGSWYLTIDLMGLKATSVRHSVEVRSAATAYREVRPTPVPEWYPPRASSYRAGRQRRDLGRVYLPCR